jgi:hypothetical protein
MIVNTIKDTNEFTTSKVRLPFLYTCQLIMRKQQQLNYILKKPIQLDTMQSSKFLQLTLPSLCQTEIYSTPHKVTSTITVQTLSTFGKSKKPTPRNFHDLHKLTINPTNMLPLHVQSRTKNEFAVDSSLH